VNVEPAFIKLLLDEQDKETALAIFSEVKEQHFSPTFRSIIKTIGQFYDKNGHIPNVQELTLFRNRDKKTLSALSSIALVDTKDVEIAQTLSILIDNYVQDSTLTLITELLDSISVMGRDEIQDTVTNMGVKLEDLVSSTEKIFSAKDYRPFVTKDIAAAIRLESGISHEWDKESGGYFLEDFILLGGKKGSGKSIVCANLIRAQHEQGNVSIYATIEMSHIEVMDRIMSAMSGVAFSKIKLKETSKEEDLKIAQAHASLFVGGLELLEAHKQDFDKFKFQDKLLNLPEIDEGRIIIIDDRNLSMATLDAKVSSYKARYGDMLKLVVVDYINQLELYPGADMYSWVNQIELSKALKNQARKHQVCLVSPYQIDEGGNARFSKGLLDSPDVAQLIKVDDKESGTIVFETEKARSASDTGVHRVGIDWTTLKIDPRAVALDDLSPAEGKEDSETISDGNII
jgi:KaiC/GvpD/RAD55 family RecA-like ATPase